MSEEYKIGSYTIETKTIYDVLKEEDGLSDAILKKLDTNGDKIISEDEYVDTESLEEEEEETEDDSTSSSSSTDVESVEEQYEQQLIALYQQLENLEDERRQLNSSFGTASDIDEYNSVCDSLESINDEIKSLRKQIYQTLYNKEAAIAAAEAAAAAEETSSTSSSTSSSSTSTISSGGVTETTITADDFDFTENLTSKQKSSVSAFVENWNENKSRYQSVAAKTGVPAELIAAIHWRESTGNFNARLSDGGSLGSFSSWEESAISALSSSYGTIDTNDITTWYNYAEHYNGMGYSNRGKTSPYVWAGTTNYSSGKYVADGVYDDDYVDQQVGVAVLLKAIMT